MKKIIINYSLITLFAIIGTSHFAHSQTYTFTKLTGTYSDLNGATSLNNNQTWFFNTVVDYITPFSYEYFGQSYDTVFVLGCATTVNENWGSLQIVPYLALSIDRGYLTGTSVSPVSYLLTGSAPNRTLKIEWKNFGFSAELDSLSTLNYYANIQLWLYEGSNVIEFHYGPSFIADWNIAYPDGGGTGPAVSLIEDNFSLFYGLIGNANNPAPSTTSYVALNGSPPDGIIYRFTPPPTGIKQKDSATKTLKVYPNPTNDILHILFNIPSGKAQLTIVDLLGKVHYKREVTGLNLNGEIDVDLTKFRSGFYIVQLSTPQTLWQSKIFKR